MKTKYIARITLLFLLVNVSCQKTEELMDFTEEDEIILGEKLSAALVESESYNIIPAETNSLAYSYAESRLNELVSASAITKGESYNWSITLLEDERRKSFALPGGYIYVTSGMIFYLDNEDQFSGLISHLVAHLNESHVTERLFFSYGVNGLKQIANSGSEEDFLTIIQDLDLSRGFLQFSRSHELEADTLAISILNETSQSCQSQGLFFSRILNIQPNSQAELISAHRVDFSRVDSIRNAVIRQACDSLVDEDSRNRYRSFRNSLP